MTYNTHAYDINVHSYSTHLYTYEYMFFVYAGWPPQDRQVGLSLRLQWIYSGYIKLGRWSFLNEQNTTEGLSYTNYVHAMLCNAMQCSAINISI